MHGEIVGVVAWKDLRAKLVFSSPEKKIVVARLDMANESELMIKPGYEYRREILGVVMTPLDCP